MQRNFKLIFNALLFLFIFLDVVLISLLTLNFIFNLKTLIVGFLEFDLLVSVLITFHFIFIIIKEKNRKDYLRKNWPDFLAIIPIAYLLALTSPGVGIIVSILLIVRILALIHYMLKLTQIIRFAEKTKLDYATFVLMATFIFGSLIFLWVESPFNPQVTNLDDSAFFMIVTMSTTGYGNIVPVTAIGRVISSIAIIVGVGYVGWVTAAIASSLIEKLRKERKLEIKKQNKLMIDIMAKLEKIEKDLEEIKDNRSGK